MLKIRRITKRDLGYISRVMQKRWDLKREEAEVEARRYLTHGKKHACWVVVDGDKPVGTGLFDYTNKDVTDKYHPWLSLLWLEPKYRGHSIGVRMTRIRMEYARKWGYRYVYLDTTEAMPYHLKRGWRKIDKASWHGEADNIMMYDLRKRFPSKSPPRVGSRLDYVRNYALSCYGFNRNSKEDHFIARLIHENMQGTRVLDLGCGPVVAVTSVFYPNAKKVVAVDRLRENLVFVKNHSEELDDVVKRAKEYRAKYLSKSAKNPDIKLLRASVVSRLKIGKFDSAMQIGCFGCLDSREDFQKAINNAYAYLKRGGTLLMVNWLGDKHDPDDMKNRFDGDIGILDIYIPSLERAGFKVKKFHKVSAVLSKWTREMGYDQMIYAVCKKT